MKKFYDAGQRLAAYRWKSNFAYSPILLSVRDKDKIVQYFLWFYTNLLSICVIDMRNNHSIFVSLPYEPMASFCLIFNMHSSISPIVNWWYCLSAVKFTVKLLVMAKQWPHCYVKLKFCWFRVSSCDHIVINTSFVSINNSFVITSIKSCYQTLHK